MNDEIRNKASELGFDLCGIARVRPLDEYRPKLNSWIDYGFNAGMHYMERNREKRLNPGLLVDGARSVIVVGMNYYRKYKPSDNQPVFARYSLGKDYHKVLKDRLFNILESIRRKETDIKGRVFVDTAPVLERAWAIEAGLGWAGKNCMLINKEIGSFFFIGVLITNAELRYDDPITQDYCGSCRKCIDACPTGAIMENRLIDSNKCLSYTSIEHKGDTPADYAAYSGRKIFGCDICQEVCPWNNKAKETDLEEFDPLPEILSYTTEQWKSITKEEFNRIFRNSALTRTGYEGFIRNIDQV